MPTYTVDVVVVGAGPAGLSAALILGRCLRSVLVLDNNRPRNYASGALHGFLTRDGLPPRELRRIGREQLKRYKTVELRNIAAVDARRARNGFQVTLADRTRVNCRKLLLATGVVDDVPKIDGIDGLYGRSVFHCPYCDGWEFRNSAAAVYSRTSNGVGLALELTRWTQDIILCTDGAARLSHTHLARLEARRIAVRRQRVARLDGAGGRLRRIVFDDGSSILRRVMFFSSGQRQQCDLAARLGCAFSRKGAVDTGKYEATNIPGLYVAGDASRLVQLAIVAASEGAQAAFAINTAMMKEDLAQGRPRPKA